VGESAASCESRSAVLLIKVSRRQLKNTPSVTACRAERLWMVEKGRTTLLESGVVIG